MLLFDFDGTLSPTVPQPELARLPDRMRRVLTGLVEMPACRVGVVSGRGLDDLRIRADVPGLLLAGSGGLEWEIDGVRGADLVKSTFRQLLLFRALGHAVPAFFHAPLLTDERGARLAKRHDALSLRALRAAGRTPEELRAGWAGSGA